MIDAASRPGLESRSSDCLTRDAMKTRAVALINDIIAMSLSTRAPAVMLPKADVLISEALRLEQIHLRSEAAPVFRDAIAAHDQAEVSARESDQAPLEGLTAHGLSVDAARIAIANMDKAEAVHIARKALAGVTTVSQKIWARCVVDLEELVAEASQEMLAVEGPRL